MTKPALRVGIGGPVGSGKTALTLSLCKALRDTYSVAVVTNDIYTQEDAQFLTRHDALPAARIVRAAPRMAPDWAAGSSAGAGAGAGAGAAAGARAGAARAASGG